MKTILLSEYNAIHPDFRSIWTTERPDLPNWEQERDQYMGKRCMMSNNDGRTCLLVEGMSFVIVDDTPKPSPGDKQFSVYGGSLKTVSHSMLIWMQKWNELLARAENSGCEGCYTEVAAWDDTSRSWKRFAFRKFFDEEIPGMSAADAAHKYAEEINRASRKQTSFIHRLDNASIML